MEVSRYFQGVDCLVPIYGTIHGHDGCMYKFSNDTYIVCTNRYTGSGGDKTTNLTTGYSGAVSVPGSFTGFKPNQKQEQKINSVKITILEFDTFVSVNQNF